MFLSIIVNIKHTLRNNLDKNNGWVLINILSWKFVYRPMANEKLIYLIK